MTRVLLVNPHAVLREALGRVLAEDEAIDVTAEAGTIAEAGPLLGAADVLVTSLVLPDGDGVDLVARLRAEHPEARAVVLALVRDEAWLDRAREAGASAVLTSAAALEDVARAIRGDGDGCRPGPPPAARPGGVRLTPREREVLQGFAAGLTAREVAAQLHISDGTLRTHMDRVRTKLHARTQAQAVVFAVRAGLVEIP
jgi:DNA-binding NarL/FixJ family response regulator